MKVFVKIMAFILMLLWGVLTIVIVFSIIGIVAMAETGKWSDWFCGGKQLLQKILD
jgi:hypothetical protein